MSIESRPVDPAAAPPVAAAQPAAPSTPRPTRSARASATATTPAATARPPKPAKAPSTNGRAAAAPATSDLDDRKAQLLASLRRHYPNADLSRVERAFDFAV